MLSAEFVESYIDAWNCRHANGVVEYLLVGTLITVWWRWTCCIITC